MALVIAIGTAGAGIASRMERHTELQRWTDDQAIPSVALITATKIGDQFSLQFPGTLRAYFDAPIYARVNGYLKKWYVDIGSRVKAGQVLAELETPELDQQMHQAEADLSIAQAKVKLAEITAKRWRNMLASDSVSKQEVDEKEGDYEAQLASKAAAAANFARLTEIAGFKRIVAPFDGVVTARKTDVGALINAGAGNGQELFRVAAIDKTRVYVEVPQTYAASIQRKMKAELHLPEDSDKSYPAVVVDTSNAINESSRTLLVQLEADNHDGKLLPGSYVDVKFALPSRSGTVRIPITALIFRQQGLQVAVVDGAGKAQFKPIELGRDFGTEVEVISGLSGSERVIDSPPDALSSGDSVRIVGAEEPHAKLADAKS